MAFAKHLQELQSEMYIKEFQDDNHPTPIKISCPVFKGKNSFFANISGEPALDKENTVISGNYEIKDDHVYFKHVNVGTKRKANAAAKDYADINYDAYPSWFGCNLSKDFCVALPPRLRDDMQVRVLVEKWIKSNIKHIIMHIIEEFIPRITTLCIKELLNRWFTTFIVNKEGCSKYTRHIIKEATKDKSDLSGDVKEDQYQPYIEYMQTLRKIFCDDYIYQNAAADIKLDYIQMFLGNLHEAIIQYMTFDSQYTTTGNECLFKFSSAPKFTIKCKKSDQIKGVVKGTFTDLDASKQRAFNWDFVGALSYGKIFYQVSVKDQLGIQADPFLQPFTTMFIDIGDLNAKTEKQRIKCIQSAVLNCIRSHWLKYICEEIYRESFSKLFIYMFGFDTITSYASLPVTRNFVSIKDFGRPC